MAVPKSNEFICSKIATTQAHNKPAIKRSNKKITDNANT